MGEAINQFFNQFSINQSINFNLTHTNINFTMSEKEK